MWSHFLGAIVLDQAKTLPGQIPQYTVIDGQQRLTTLQLLVAAAASALAEAGAENDAELLRELVMNNPRKTHGVDRLKVWPTNANRAAFTAVMSADGPPADHIDDPENLIDEAFAYFKTLSAEYLAGDDEGPDEPTDPGDQPLPGAGDAAEPAWTQLPRSAANGFGSRCATCSRSSRSRWRSTTTPR